MAGLKPEKGMVYNHEGDIYIYFNSNLHVRVYRDGDVQEASDTWYEKGEDNPQKLGNLTEMFKTLYNKLKELT